MATLKNYTQLSRPPYWVSAHRPIEYLYDVPTENAIIFDQNNEGFMSFWSGIFMNNPNLVQVGDLVYVVTGIYKGFHTVKSVQNSPTTQLIVTNTPFTGFSNSEVKYAEPPVFTIMRGWKAGEVAYTNPYDYKVLTTFQPELNLDGQLYFDISGYIQSGLTPITHPQQGSFYSANVNRYQEFNIYFPFRLLTPTAEGVIHYGLNSGISTEELNAKYINTNTFLMQQALSWGCGLTVATILVYNIAYTYIGQDDLMQVETGFSDGFSSGFFRP